MSAQHTPETAGQLAASYCLNLSGDEMLDIIEALGREPSRTEAYIFDVAWSEHCSYKSSRWALGRYLPTDAANVVLGPGEDAGIVRLFTDEDGVGRCIAVAHESHNHPSQVLPEEGAATGIGGIVRDVYCMGAEVVGVLDPLRFGDPVGENGRRTRAIVRGVVDGIWRYGNPIGVPNLGGDVVFDECYDDNCLVNVIALGILDEDKIIRSHVPDEAQDEDYVLMLVGKPTDDTGVGGASFASAVLDEDDDAANKGAVQVPDPFLKRVLTEATKTLLITVREKGIAIGIKDLGAGGLSGASGEIVAAAGVGATIDLDKVPLSIPDLPPEVIAVAESQERYVMAVPAHFADEVARIYNEEFELPRVFEGAGATVIGEVNEEPYYTLTHRGEVVAELHVEIMTAGVRYDRSVKPMAPPVPGDVNERSVKESLYALLSSLNVCSRRRVVDHYDRHVQGITVVEAGSADAGVIAPWFGSRKAIAVSADGSPYIGRLDPYGGGAHSVLEAVRNLVCVGAEPVCITDCLNFGNPEVPGVMWQFTEAVRGIGDACRGIGLRSSPGDPLPVVSGNVSFYNESDTGAAVYPSPVVAAFGYLDDFARATTSTFKAPGNIVYLVGRRWGEMGASQLYRLDDAWGDIAPRPRFADERNMMNAVLELNHAGLVKSAHDISEGGLAAALAEMLFAPYDEPHLGAKVDLAKLSDNDGNLSFSDVLFCENGGYILEIERGVEARVLEILDNNKTDYYPLGEITGKAELMISSGGETVLNEPVEALAKAWREGLDNIF
ncbi:MAG: phosphoribosylformylglycinamidine synthase subunit PurL [bacterium]|nr:phosphoribosylformylglycinamidine synthase subunit PurL [bacterium]